MARLLGLSAVDRYNQGLPEQSRSPVISNPPLHPILLKCYHSLSVHHSAQLQLSFGRMQWQETPIAQCVDLLHEQIPDPWEGRLSHGGAEHLYWHKRWHESCLNLSEHQHICVGIAFHRREQDVSLLERTFWLKEETPATVSLDCKKQQKGA